MNDNVAQFFAGCVNRQLLTAMFPITSLEGTNWSMLYLQLTALHPICQNKKNKKNAGFTCNSSKKINFKKSNFVK